MEAEKYNGWTNRETWIVNLWLNNDEGLYRETVDTMRRAVVHGLKLGPVIETMVRDTMPESGLIADLIGFALAEVNWEEIAQGFREDLE